MPTTGRSTFLSADRLIGLLLFVVTVVYVASLPRNLGPADESFFLYEARRIREGDVMYRDFFQFVAPGAWYAMALLYWVFGTDMATARISLGVLHGLTAVFSYLTCRRLGVRREIATLVPLFYLAVCQAPWPYASPHWFNTVLVALLIYLAAKPTTAADRDAGRESAAAASTISAARCFGLGIVVGILIIVQQQKGVIMAVGGAVALVLDHLISRRYESLPFRHLLKRLTFFSGGVLVVVVSVMSAMMAAAGWRPVFEDLVQFPLQSYPNYVRDRRWGGVPVLAKGYAAYTWPTVLKWLPVALVPLLVQATLYAFRGRNREQVRQLSVVIVFGVFAIVSILYHPDFIHIALTAPVLLIAAAASCEWVLSSIPLARLAYAAGWIVALTLGVFLGRQVYANTVLSHRQYPLSHQTAFGRVDFAATWEPILVDTVRGLLPQAGSDELFCYPLLAGPYLTTGARNPTPFLHLMPQQSPPAHMEKALSVLEARPPPYIIASLLFLKAEDPIARLINDRYEFLALPGLSIFEPRLALFQRKDLQLSPNGRD